MVPEIRTLVMAPMTRLMAMTPCLIRPMAAGTMGPENLDDPDNSNYMPKSEEDISLVRTSLSSLKISLLSKLSADGSSLPPKASRKGTRSLKPIRILTRLQRIYNL